MIRIRATKDVLDFLIKYFDDEFTNHSTIEIEEIVINSKEEEKNEKPFIGFAEFKES